MGKIIFFSFVFVISYMATFAQNRQEQLFDENVKYSMHPQSLAIVMEAMKKAGVTPKPQPIRAGTTAAMMAARGLAGGLCLFTGQNAEHTVKEWVCLEDMYKAYETMVNVVAGVAEMKDK